jgi:hypothetical protein
VSSRVLANELRLWRAETWRWQDVIGARRTPAATRSLAGVERSQRLVRIWQRRARRAKAVALSPPHADAWACIHRYEGNWHASTGNGYYGGLQLSLEFQRTYGRLLLARKGTADHWTPLEQIWAAERAYRSGRGFWPWPSTARICGLL